MLPNLKFRWGKQAPGEGIPADDFGQPWRLRRGYSFLGEGGGSEITFYKE